MTGAALLILVLALILERTIRLIRNIGLANLQPDIALAMLATLIPDILAISLPPALFAGTLLTFQRLVRDNEIEILQGSGIGPVRMMRPVVVATALTAAMSMLVLWYLLPLSKYQFRSLLHEVARSAVTAPISPGSFVEIAGKVLYVQPGDGQGQAVGRIFLYDPDDQGQRYVTTARAGDFGLSPDHKSLFLRASDGRRVSLPGPGGQPTLLTFNEVQSKIYGLDWATYRARGKDSSELTLPELLWPAANSTQPGPDPAKSRALLHIKLARVLVVLLFPLVAVPIALGFPVARQWIGLSAGAFFVLAVDQGLILGETAVGQWQTSPWFAVWGVVAAVTLIALLLWSATGQRGKTRRRTPDM